MGTYGQYCPIAKALELLDERWTVLVIRELLCGSRHFNEIRRGVPRMSPALLTKRLQRLMRAGLVERHTNGNRVTYLLTPAGRELQAVVEAIGGWGVRWMPELGDEELDPHLLMWDMHRSVNLAELPPGRTTVHFRFRGPAPEDARNWWMIMAGDGTDICDFDPGYPVAATVDADLQCLVRVWRGDLSWREALRSGAIEVLGPSQARRAVPRWFGQSMFAPVPRPEVPRGPDRGPHPGTVGELTHQPGQVVASIAGRRTGARTLSSHEP